jgi:predicted Zn-dependent protease with MMP-like domain
MVDFEKLVQEATLTLHKEIQEKMENVVICVAQNPSQFELKKAGTRISGTLLGLYQGFPKTVWGRNNISGRLPDKITIFQDSIERLAKTEEDTKELVRIVVWHEIAHHFGFNEKQVRGLEAKWRRDIKK